MPSIAHKPEGHPSIIYSSTVTTDAGQALLLQLHGAPATEEGFSFQVMTATGELARLQWICGLFIDELETAVTDDGDGDLDEDGLTNTAEYLASTRPDLADTDGDGLSDLEEQQGITGFATDPLLADSDGDGVDDAEDQAPTDASTTTLDSPPEEPVVAVETTELALEGDRLRMVGIRVTNAGTGTLRWSADTSDPRLVMPSNMYPDLGQEGEKLVVAISHAAASVQDGTGLQQPRIPHPDLRNAPVTITVTDRSGAVPDTQEVKVWLHEIGEEEPDAGTEDGGDAGEQDAGADSGGADQAQTDNDVPPLLTLFSVGLFRQRRRHR